MKIITLIVLIMFGSISIKAQTADFYFHSSSNYFINGDFKAAKAEVEKGLSHFPNDKKLRSLNAEIKKEEEKEKEKEKEKENKDQNDQNNDQQKQDQNKKDQNQQQKQDQQNQQQQQQQQQQSQISKEDAMRLLEALQNDEKNVQEKVQKQKVQVKKRSVEKDW